jgi:hypothetical protein
MIPEAKLKIESRLTNPPLPIEVGVMVQGRVIAVVELEELKHAYHRLLELETTYQKSRLKK